MTIRITDTATFKTYTATSTADCKGSTDRAAFEMAERLGDVITMGKIIAEPVTTATFKTFETLAVGDTYVSSRWKGRTYTETVKMVSVSNQYGRRVAHIVHERDGDVAHMVAGKTVEVIEKPILPKMTATCSPNGYLGNETRSGKGFNVYLGSAGTILSGLPKSWAEKAVRLINDQADYDAQLTECRRICASL